jgi:hypothetical protein
MRDPETPEMRAVLNLDSFDLAAPDFSVPLARASATADRLATPDYSPSVSRIWLDFPRVTDIVSFPFGLNSGNMKGLSAAVEPGPSLRVAECVMTGPFSAQTLPSGTLELRNVVYTPPESAENLRDGWLRTASLLLPKLGQDVLDVTVRLAYSSEPASGLYRVTLNELSAKGAGELSGSVAIEGIRPELMEPLSGIFLSDLHLLSFGQDLENIALQRVQLNYSDRGLFPAYYSLLAEAASREPTEVRDVLIQNLSGQILETLGDQLADPEPLLSEIRLFMTAPSTFTASAAPDPPLSHKVKSAIPADDPGAIRNILNITFSANGSPPSPLRFKTETETAETPDGPGSGGGTSSGDGAVSEDGAQDGSGSEDGESNGSDSGEGAGE